MSRSAANTSSLTELALAPGVLNTTMPRLEQASTGTLLTPTPARATATTLSAHVAHRQPMAAQQNGMRVGYVRADLEAVIGKPRQPSGGDLVESPNSVHRLTAVLKALRGRRARTRRLTRGAFELGNDETCAVARGKTSSSVAGSCAKGRRA